MLHAIEVISILLVALAMAPALAHLLEFPGKQRLTKDTYFAVQPIYYPGFTIAGGIGEGGGLVSVLVVLLLTQRDAAAFWLRLVALLAMLGMEILFWLLTQPVNKFWLQDTPVSLGATFSRLDREAIANVPTILKAGSECETAGNVLTSPERDWQLSAFYCSLWRQSSE